MNNQMTQRKVIKEYYRVDREQFDEVSDAVFYAYGQLADRKQNYRSITVERITHVEAADESEKLFGMDVLNHIVTGRLDIKGPASAMFSAELSRYNPVNGWCVPEHIDVQRDKVA
jgi:hypothetical protein